MMQLSQQDVGGTSIVPPLVNIDEDRIDPPTWWEARIDALQKLLGKQSNENWRLNDAALRARIESLPTAVFSSWSYYGRWGAAIANFGITRNIWTQLDLIDALGVSSGSSSRAKDEIPVGTKVLVRGEHEPIPFRQPHSRTPGYVHNCVGVVVARLHDEIDQDWLAHRHLLPTHHQQQHEAPKLRVYRVRFLQKDIFTNVANLEIGNDEVDVEIFEDWLKPITRASSGTSGRATREPNVEIEHHSDDDDDDDDHHDHHDHEHEERWRVEVNAVNNEGAPAIGERFCRALVSVALKKGVVTEAALQATVEQRAALTSLPAKKLVARAWLDPAFKRRLLDEKQTNAIVKEVCGIELSVHLVCVENTAKIHNVVVCTLCSCFPTPLLGRPPQWYKEKAYRSRVVREPRAVLKEFGCVVDEEQKVRVVDSTSECRYLVIPERPPGTESFSEERLVEVITRDSMIGVRKLNLLE